MNFAGHKLLTPVVRCKRMRRELWILGIILCLSSGSLAANWPQWRGPSLNGSTNAAHDLPLTWTETENVRWRVKLPNWSAATPIIWEDTVFITSSEPGFVRLGQGRRGAD